MARTPPRALPRTGDRRADILDAAARLFAERGFHATSTRDICLAVGMSAGNLYHWFPSKQAIIAELLQADAAAQVARLDALADAGDLHDVAPAALLEFVTGAGADMVSRLLDGYAAALRDPELAPIVRAADAAARNRLAEVLAAAGVPDAEAAATVLVALIDGLLARRALEPARDLAALGPAIAAVTRALFAARAGE